MTSISDTYLKMLSEFTEGKLAARAFQLKYFEVYKNDEREMSQAEFEVLDWLFGEVDDYTFDPQLRREAGGLDDNELLDRAEVAKSRLLGI